MRFLGTGISKPLAGVIRDVVEELNQRDIAVIAADIPTGLHGDKGCALGVAVRAHHTVTMVALKRGLFTGEAARYCGQVEYADLGVMREFRMQTGADAWRLDSEQLTKWLGPRDKIAHKGESGHVLVIGGAQGMAGAAGMCGLAALRAGAGKVSVICGAGQEGLAALTPEMMVRSGSVDDSALLSLLEHADVIALGPGLGQSEWAQQWWQRAIDTEKPLIVDADGLNLLAQLPVERDNWILTRILLKQLDSWHATQLEYRQIRWGRGEEPACRIWRNDCIEGCRNFNKCRCNTLCLRSRYACDGNRRYGRYSHGYHCRLVCSIRELIVATRRSCVCRGVGSCTRSRKCRREENSWHNSDRFNGATGFFGESRALSELSSWQQ